MLGSTEKMFIISNVMYLNGVVVRMIRAGIFLDRSLLEDILGTDHKCRNAYSSPFRRVGTLVMLSTRFEQPLLPYLTLLTFVNIWLVVISFKEP